MGFRTDSMMRTAERFRDAEQVGHYGWINNRGWRFRPGDEQVDACYSKEVHNGRRPPEADTCVCYKDSSGKRKMVCFIFLALTFACVIAGVLHLDAFACAAGVC